MNWLHNLWYGYFWPSLQGNGPEALVQTVVYGAIAIIFIPPVRRWFTSHFHGLRDHITAEHAKIHDRLDRSHERQDDLTAHLNHIIKHSKDIPDFKPPKA